MTSLSLSALDDMSTKGEFMRKESTFRATNLPSATPDALNSRYHLYVSYACPWAHRTLIVRALKGLDNAIDVSVTHPTWGRTRPDKDEHNGWIFREGRADEEPVTPPAGVGAIDTSGCVPDPVNGAPDVRALYELSSPDSEVTKFTVPILFDKEENSIINNESSEIIRMLNSCFDEVAEKPDVDLYPEHLRGQIDAVNEWIYPNINNGVYRCGFAQSQEAYDQAVEGLFRALDRVEEILSSQRYLVGSEFTEADVRLWVTLIRFDEVYTVYFKCNIRQLSTYPNIRNYMREIYQMEGVAATTNMDHIKNHYYTSHAKLNAYAVVPRGPGVIEDMRLAHDRARFD